MLAFGLRTGSLSHGTGGRATMDDTSYYRLDWSRPIGPRHDGERTYHATSDDRHILVRVSNRQLLAAETLARRLRKDDPDILVQTVLEEIITRAVEVRPLRGGELQLLDEDFAG